MPRKIKIGANLELTPVILAPMSGVTDLPFRATANNLKSPLVVSEMLASRELVQERQDVVRKAARGNIFPFAIQLIGNEPHWMGEGARIAADLGADIIDINMGCPAREVTGKQSGSALMRDVDHALGLIDAVVSAVKLPVTLKMRLGWDRNSQNAAELASRAEKSGIAMLTIHARTRCQFFNGAANWSAVKAVKQAVSVPVIVNGDIVDPSSAAASLAESGADGIMIGRGAYGAPWQPARIAATLATGRDPGPPPPSQRRNIALAHYDDMLSHYGVGLGVKNARKHLGWYLATSGLPENDVKNWRSRLCREDDPNKVRRDLHEAYQTVLEHGA